jgi:D-3-phosphoglycerate dehydrogenase|tara:strand:+ start:652 stop:918 length:267 start_codon:yes stop_codon:yes gene_type:complete
MTVHGVFLVNTSCGEVVDDEALLGCLKSGKIIAAGLDVITGEITKDRINHQILKYAEENKNLIVTPHIAGSTFEFEYKTTKFVFESII